MIRHLYQVVYEHHCQAFVDCDEQIVQKLKLVQVFTADFYFASTAKQDGDDAR